MVTATKCDGKCSVHVVSSTNKIALTHVNALLVHHTRLCAYSLQNVLLLAQMFQVCVTMNSRQQEVKAYTHKIPPTGFLFTDGLMTISKLVPSVWQDKISVPTQTIHNYIQAL